MVEKQETRGDFRFRHIGKNHVVIYPHPEIHADSALVQTGSDIEYPIDIPYFHRIVKLVLIHLDTSNNKSTDAMKVILELKKGVSIFSKLFTDMLFQETDIKSAEFIEMFKEGFEYEPRTWTLTLNTTNTDKVIPVLYIQKESEPR